MPNGLVSVWRKSKRFRKKPPIPGRGATGSRPHRLKSQRRHILQLFGQRDRFRHGHVARGHNVFNRRLFIMPEEHIQT
jgi:hypothetical protein